mgnify:CR=1 FL=1
MELELLQDFKDYLGYDYEEEQEKTLLFCIKRAVSSFKNKRNYPDYYSEELINKDMEKYYACIFDLCLYWYGKQGAEFEKSHSENGTSHSWDNESDIYSLHRVMPIARII